MPSKPYTEDTARADKARRIKANKDVQTTEEGTPEDQAEFQEQLRVELEERGFPPLLSRKILDFLDASKAAWAYCPDCHKKVQVDRPDTSVRLKALETAMGYVVGRPKERKELEVSVSQKPLHEMTDEELEQAARVSLTQ